MSFEDALGEKQEIRHRKGLKVKACLVSWSSGKEASAVGVE